MKGFEIAAGSIIGKDHLRLNKNNQDAYNIIRRGGNIIAVVCDGCGSGAHSEVGAKIAAFSLPQKLSVNAHIGDLAPAEVYGVYSLNAQITDMAVKMIWGSGKAEERIVEVVRDYFLFTCVVAIITELCVVIASVGDGVYAINGKIKHIGPFPNNAPPYSSYGIVPQAVDERFRDPKFQIHEIISTESFQSLMIGSDGVEDLQAVEEKTVPGKDELVGPLNQFWTDDRYFTNKMALQRRLVRINKEVVKVVDGVATRQHGHLRDDTTMVVVRRRDDSISKQ